MELYLMRHGIAADRALYNSNDEARPLTSLGRKKTTKVAEKFLEIGLRFDLILTSPLVRARQTAEILQKVGLSQLCEEFEPLAPDGDIQAWINWRSKSRYNGKHCNIALVGHQPDLGSWAEILVWGTAKHKLVVKKAGAIALHVPETGTPVGKSTIFLLTSPKWFL